MSTHSKVDLSTLGWVRTEIDETLKQARLGLESYAENPVDKTRLRFCATYLHQVVGTLLMVELDGAAMLAREMEALAEAVINDQAAPDSKTFDVLTRGMLTLPDYLARLQYGQLDVPLRHVALINELRAAHNVTPISELALFAPDLSVRPPHAEPGATLAEAEYREFAKQLRGTFQPALLDWLRDTANKQPLRAIMDVFASLQAKASQAALGQLFWVAGGFIEAMIDDGLAVTAEHKKLFARLDQQLKKIVDGADKTMLRHAAESLTTALLWDIAHATSTGARVTQLKQAFELEALLTGGGVEVPETRDLPTPEAMQSVSAALGKEIEAAQDLMSTFFDPESGGTVSLEPLIELFRKMSGALDMLNMPTLKALVDELSQVSRALLDNQIAHRETASMQMAEALLMVESSTRDITRSPVEWKKQIEQAAQRLHALHAPGAGQEAAAVEGLEVSDGELTESDYKQLLSVVASEVSVNLGRIEEALEGFATDTARTQELDDVPQMLSQILGAMQILGQTHAAELVAMTKQHIEEIRSGALVADSAIMDGLAVCIGSIGAFIEGLSADRPNLDVLIDVALKEMKAAVGEGHGKQRDPALLMDGVRLGLESWLDEPDNAQAREALGQQLAELTQLAETQGQEKMARIGQEMNHLLDRVAEDHAQMSSEIVETLKASFMALSALAGRHMTLRTAASGASVAESEERRAPEISAPPVARTVPPPVAAPVKEAKTPPVKTAADEEFDAEIMEIFIEDARDVIEGIKSNFPVWSADTTNKNALTELRRGFHTLKGSGRMVGASEVAELAWAIENLFNRIRDGKLEVSPEIMALLTQMPEVLPRLVDVLAGGSPHGIDVETLRETAHALAQSAPPVAMASVSAPVSEAVPEPVPEPAVVAEVAPEPSAAPPAETGDLPQLDPVLLEIFTTEARGNLANIHQELAACHEAGGSCLVSSVLFRSVHTLQGNARSLGIEVMLAPCAETEKMLDAIRSNNLPLNGASLALVARFESLVSDLIERMNSGAVSSGDLRQPFADLTRDLHAANAHVTQADAEQEVAEAEEEQPAEFEMAPETSSQERSQEEEPTVEEIAFAPLPAGEEVSEQIDPELLEIFLEEATDILGTIEDALSRWRGQPGSRELVQEIKRSLHTLKGGARMAGAMSMGELSHSMETLLKAIEDGEVSASSDLFDLLDETHDMLVTMLSHAQSGQPAPDIHALHARIHALFAGEAVPAPEAPAPVETVSQEIPQEEKPSAEEIIVVSAPASPVEIVPEPTEPAAPVSSSAPVSVAAPSLSGATEQIDPELLEIFLEEATDILGTIEDALSRWRGQPNSRELVQEIKRSLHTLKGGARMAGAMSMGELSHSMETLLKATEDGEVSPSSDLFDLLDETHDMLVTMLSHAQSGQPAPDIRGLYARLHAVVAGEPVPEAPAAAPMETQAQEIPLPQETEAPVEEIIVTAAFTEIVEPEPVASPPVVKTPAPKRKETVVVEDHRQVPEAEEKQWPEKSDRQGQVRVNTGLLNDLVNYAGEVSISRSRMEQQIYSVRENLSELSRNITRFREQIRELEIQTESQMLYRLEQEASAVNHEADFDPLELDRFSRLQQLSRSLAESLHDLGTIQNNLGNFVGEAEAVLQQQARINTELQQGLMRTRMVNFSTQAARLRHMVRQTARELGKRVELNLEGAEVEVDRNVLERMLGPFEHMIRNSIDHGMESEAERRKKGKPPTGRISITTVQQGSEIVIRVSDDGAGLNIEAIRAKAIERGLLPSDASLSEEEVIQFILMPGFSTATKITQVSGRGVGMDVVHSEVKQLGGSMSVDTERGVGTTFIILLPLTLSITQALMAYVGNELFALPLGSVVNIIELPVEKIAEVKEGGHPQLAIGEQTYPFMHLGQRLGIVSSPRNGKKIPILLARAGTREVAIQVDGLSGTREVVIKPLGPQLSTIKGLAGATILGDGRVILILDLPGLWHREDVIHFEHRPMVKAAPEVRARPVVMVVDDSLTVRKVTSKHLQKRGIDVLTAKDGLDAVEQLRDHVPDVMLVDIEMPRMDGYELTTRVRADENLKHIPIIMITSRAGSKHRQKAFDLGVDMYMSKPYQEEELYRNVESLLASGRTS